MEWIGLRYSGICIHVIAIGENVGQRKMTSLSCMRHLLFPDRCVSHPLVSKPQVSLQNHASISYSKGHCSMGGLNSSDLKVLRRIS